MPSRETFQRLLKQLKSPQILDRDAKIVRTKTTVPACTFYKAYKAMDAAIGCTPSRDYWDDSSIRAVLDVGTRHVKEGNGGRFVTRKVPFTVENSFGFDTLLLVGSQTHRELSEDDELHRATVLIYPVHYCEATGEETKSEWEFLLRKSLDPADWQRSSTRRDQDRNHVPFHRVKFDVPYFGFEAEYRLATWPWTSDLIRTVYSEQRGWVAIHNVDGCRIDVSPRRGGVGVHYQGAGTEFIDVKREAVESVWDFITPTRALRNQQTEGAEARTGTQQRNRTTLIEKVEDSLRVVRSHGGFVVLRGKTYYAQFAVNENSRKTASFEVVSNANLDESHHLTESQREELKQRGFGLSHTQNWWREVDLSSPANVQSLGAESVSILLDLFGEQASDIEIVFEVDGAWAG